MLVTDDQVRNHLRIDEGEDVSVYVGAAERAAIDFLNRNVYKDQDALDAAQLTVTPTLIAARATYVAAVAEASAIEDRDASIEAKTYALDQYFAARLRAYRIRKGIVVNEAVQAAILLTIGHLYANREDVVVGASVVELPMASQHLLQPYRVCMGV